MDSSLLNVILPAPLVTFVVSEAKQQGFGSPDEYVRFVLEEQQRKAIERLEAMLDESVASGPGVAYTPEQWRERQRQMVEKLQHRDSK